VHLFARLLTSSPVWSRSMHDDVLKANALLTDIRTLLAELRSLCLLSDQHQVQYLAPLTTKESDLHDGGSPAERVLDFTGNEYAPVPVKLRDRINDIWGFTPPPHRLQNSLPRYLGHIAIPRDHTDKATTLIERTNEAKRLFGQLADRIHIQSGMKEKRYRVTDALIEYNIIDDSENAELITRPLIYTLHHEVAQVGNTWVSKPSQPKVGKYFQDTIDALDTGTHPILVDAIRAFEEKHPGSKYAVRYESPPSPEIRYKYQVESTVNVRGLHLRRLANSSPLLVLNWNDDTIFKSSLPKLDVTYDASTSVIAIVKKKHKANEPVRLLKTENWYGFPPKANAPEVH